MGRQTTEDNLRSALRGHVADEAAHDREQYGLSFGDGAIRRLLNGARSLERDRGMT